MGTMEEWRKFLTRQGSIHLIVKLGEDPRRYSELEARVPISTDTLTRRLKKGVKIDMWELDLIERDGRDIRVYRLTDDGQATYDRLAEAVGVDASYRVREARADFEDAREELRDLIQPDE